jgi:IS5 family transposase
MREAQVNIAIRWFAGYGLHETLPDHSSLTRIRRRRGVELFRRFFQGTARGEIVRRRLRRAEAVPFFSRLPPCLVEMEACARWH